jgi:hypothetical protein
MALTSATDCTLPGDGARLRAVMRWSCGAAVAGVCCLVGAGGSWRAWWVAGLLLRWRVDDVR